MVKVRAVSWLGSNRLNAELEDRRILSKTSERSAPVMVFFTRPMLAVCRLVTCCRPPVVRPLAVSSSDFRVSKDEVIAGSNSASSRMRSLSRMLGVKASMVMSKLRARARLTASRTERLSRGPSHSRRRGLPAWPGEVEGRGRGFGGGGNCLARTRGQRHPQGEAKRNKQLRRNNRFHEGIFQSVWAKKQAGAGFSVAAR